MKTSMAAAWIGLMVLVPASAGEVPFAERSPLMADASVPGLGDLMLIAQMRHIKLWYAGKTGSWPLAEFELHKILELLGKAATLYTAIPVSEISKVDDPLSVMLQAARKGDGRAFQAGYMQLTTACNSCHESAGVAFIHIQTPGASPFTNQTYPERR